MRSKRKLESRQMSHGYLHVIVFVITALIIGGCATHARRPLLPDEDLTAYERARILWTSEFPFRRFTGGDELVSEQSQVTHRPRHEQTLLFAGTLYADTLVALDQQRICAEDTSNTPCDSLTHTYDRGHRRPDEFRIEIRLAAIWTQPLSLGEMTIFLKDNNDIDYEPSRIVYGSQRSQRQSYVDQAVTRINPYSQNEQRYYRLERGNEFRTQADAVLYFERVNVVGDDLFDPSIGPLNLIFKLGRQEYGRLTWDLASLRYDMLHAQPGETEPTFFEDLFSY